MREMINAYTILVKNFEGRECVGDLGIWEDSIEVDLKEIRFEGIG
jgi:hypothetical protein